MGHVGNNDPFPCGVRYINVIETSGSQSQHLQVRHGVDHLGCDRRINEHRQHVSVAGTFGHVGVDRLVDKEDLVLGKELVNNLSFSLIRSHVRDLHTLLIITLDHVVRGYHPCSQPVPTPSLSLPCALGSDSPRSNP